MEDRKLDLYYPIDGREIPLDHGYALFSAIAHCLETSDDPWLHAAEDVGIHLIRGRFVGDGRLAVGPGSRLGIRLPAALVPRFLPLAGKKIVIGNDVVRLGIPQPKALQPAPSLYAHLVTTKNGHEEGRFDAEVSRQVEAMGIRGLVQRGKRRTFSVKDKKVVAYSLVVGELVPEASIRLQEVGLGGRRRLGCGVFLPAD